MQDGHVEKCLAKSEFVKYCSRLYWFWKFDNDPCLLYSIVLYCVVLQQGESTPLILVLHGHQFLSKGTCLRSSSITILLPVRMRCFHLIIIIIIITTTMFMVLSSWHSHCESYPVHLMNADWAPVGRQPSDQTNRFGLWVCRKIGCYHPPTPSPFIIITQLVSWYSFYRPTEGGRLSRPRHCSKGAQPVPKDVYRSDCRDKHDRPRWDSNLGPLAPQSGVLPLSHRELWCVLQLLLRDTDILPPLYDVSRTFIMAIST